MTQPFSHAFQTIYIMTMILVQVLGFHWIGFSIGYLLGFLYWVSIGYLQKTTNGVQS